MFCSETKILRTDTKMIKVLTAEDMRLFTCNIKCLSLEHFLYTVSTLGHLLAETSFILSSPKSLKIKTFKAILLYFIQASWSGGFRASEL